MIRDSRNASDTAELLFKYFADANGTPRDRVAVTEMKTQLPEEFLMMTDRFSMAQSLEARTPFLDNELVDMVLSIPSEHRTRRGDLKGLLRRAIAPILPQELLRAPKRGFVLPLTLWLRNQLRPVCEQLLSRERLGAQGLINPDFYDHYVRPHIDGRADHTNRIWAVLMFQLWHSTFIEESGSGPVGPIFDSAMAKSP